MGWPLVLILDLNNKSRNCVSVVRSSMKRKRSNWKGNKKPDTSPPKKKRRIQKKKKKKKKKKKNKKKGILAPLLEQPIRGPFEHVLSFLSNIKIYQMATVSRSFYLMFQIRKNEISRSLSQVDKRFLMRIPGCVSCFLEDNLDQEIPKKTAKFKISSFHRIKCQMCCFDGKCPHEFSKCPLCNEKACRECLSKCGNWHCKKNKEYVSFCRNHRKCIDCLYVKNQCNNCQPRCNICHIKYISDKAKHGDDKDLEEYYRKRDRSNRF